LLRLKSNKKTIPGPVVMVTCPLLAESKTVMGDGVIICPTIEPVVPVFVGLFMLRMLMENWLYRVAFTK
jgi:hypothetical protein